MKEETRDKLYHECFKEMFRRVGEKYPNEEIISKENWYQLRSWTDSEEKDFRFWMRDYLRKKTKLNKKMAKTHVLFFLLQYGWTNKQKLPLIKVLRR